MKTKAEVNDKESIDFPALLEHDRDGEVFHVLGYRHDDDDDEDASVFEGTIIHIEKSKRL